MPRPSNSDVREFAVILLKFFFWIMVGAFLSGFIAWAASGSMIVAGFGAGTIVFFGLVILAIAFCRIFFF